MNDHEELRRTNLGQLLREHFGMMKRDNHEAAREWAIALMRLNDHGQGNNLAACYLDSVPKEQYDRLRELASAAWESRTLGHTMEEEALRNYLTRMP